MSGNSYEKARVRAAEAATIAASGAVPDAKKASAEKLLLGAILREPYRFSDVIGGLNQVALSNASDGLAPAFASIIRQFLEEGRYNSYSVLKETGIDVSAYATLSPEIDIAWALDNWREEYQVWAETTACVFGMAAAYEGADAMRARAEEERDRLGLGEQKPESDPINDFTTWAEMKLSGNEPPCLTVPHIKAVREIVHGFMSSALIIIAGRPGMGKTQAALNLHNYFAESGVPGVFISLEMSTRQLYSRWIGIKYGINANADWSMLEQKEIAVAVSGIADMGAKNPISDGVYDISEIEAYLTAMNRKHGVEYAIIDYLQLMSDRSKGGGNREAEVSSISRRIKRLAKRLNIAIIALSQLSRDNEKRGGSKRPSLSDLRDSGAIEQDADTVIFLYRPEYYEIHEDEYGNSLKGIGEWIVAKQRNGALGIAKTKWNPIRGYTDIPDEPFTPRYKGTSAPVDFTVPSTPISEFRPATDEDIPF